MKGIIFKCKHHNTYAQTGNMTKQICSTRRHPTAAILALNASCIKLNKSYKKDVSGRIMSLNNTIVDTLPFRSDCLAACASYCNPAELTNA